MTRLSITAHFERASLALDEALERGTLSFLDVELARPGRLHRPERHARVYAVLRRAGVHPEVAALVAAGFTLDEIINRMEDKSWMR